MATKRLPTNIPSGEVDISKVIGATVRLVSACQAQGWIENVDQKTYTIEDILFRISTDGKTFAIIKLKGLDDKTFTWKDIEFISLNNE